MKKELIVYGWSILLIVLCYVASYVPELMGVERADPWHVLIYVILIGCLRKDVI